MPALAFTLELVDRVSSNAKKATEFIRRIEDQGKKTQKALDFGGDVKRLQDQLNRLKVDPKGFQQMIRLRKELAQQQAKLKDQMSPQGFFSSFTKALPFRSIAQYTQAAAFGTLIAEGIMKAGSLLIDAAKAMVNIVVDGFKAAVKAASGEEVLRLGEKLTLGKGAKGFREDVDRFSGLTGFDDDVIRKQLLGLRRAGFGELAARSAFAGAADIAAGLGMGGNQEAVGGILESFTKIKLKEGIGEKQLVGMGVSPKEVYADIAKQLGIGIKEAEKKVTAGEIDDPQRIINAILSGIERKQGGELGTGSLSYSKTFEAKWRKITELPDNYLKKLVDSPAWGKLTEAATKFLEFLDPEGPTGKRVFASLEETFSNVVGWIEEMTSEEGMKQFGAGLQTVVDTAKTLVSVFSTIIDILRQAANIAETVATPRAKIFATAQAAGAAEAYKRGTQMSVNDAVGLAQATKFWGLDQMVAGVPRAAASGGGGKNTTVAPMINVSVSGDSKNPEDTGRRVGRAAATDIQRAAERARNEAGT